MTFARLHVVVAYAIAGLGLGALAVGGGMSFVSTALAFAALATVFIPVQWMDLPNWSRASTAAVIGFLVIQVARGTLLGGEPLELSIEFAIGLQCSRLANRRTAREFEQIVVLAFVHLIGASVISTDLGYAVVFLGFVIVAPWMLTLTHMRREIEANYPPRAKGDMRAGADVERVLASKRVIGPRFLAATSFLSLPLFLGTASLFIAFPRVGLGLFDLRANRTENMTGFGDSVTLGAFGVLRSNPTVVARVSPPSWARGQPRISLRLRGTAFDHYDGRRWSRTMSTDRPLERFDQVNFPLPGRDHITRGERLTISLEPLEERIVFLPEQAALVEVPRRIVRGVPTPRELTIGTGYEVRYRAEDDVGFLYHVTTQPRALTLPRLPSDGSIDRFLAIPPGHERVVAFARDLAARGTDERTRIAILLRELRESGRYRYSVEMPTVGRREQPIDVFLFRARRGHCEYFATTLAIMLRGIGIPARVVNGFLGGELNRFSPYYAIRQGDAHSWVEAWVESIDAWVVLDPTPAAGTAPIVNDSLGAVFAAFIDALRDRWRRSVVSFDLDTQVSLARKLRRLFRGSSSSNAPSLRPGLSPAVTRRAGAIAGGALLLGLGIYWWVRRRRIRDPNASPVRRAHAATALLREIDTTLARYGHARPPNRTITEHVHALPRDAFRPQREELDSLVARYVSARFGEQSIDRSELRALRARARALESQDPRSER